MKRLITYFGALLLALVPLAVQAQVTTLNATADTFRIVLGGAAATTEPTYSVLWEGTGGPAVAIGVTTGATAKTMLAGVTGEQPKSVKQVTLHNSDTAAVTATFTRVSGGTTYQVGKYVLPSLSTLNWTDTQVRVTDGSGQQATTTIDYGSVGSASASTVVATETTNGYIRRTRLTLTAVSVAMVDATVQGGGTKIYDFPAGNIAILGAVGSVAPTTTSTIATTVKSGVVGVWAVGTTVAAANAALTTTEANAIPSTAWTSSTTINVAAATVVGVSTTAANQADGTTTAADLYLNACVTTGTDIDGDGTVTWSGYIDVTWIPLGDG